MGLIKNKLKLVNKLSQHLIHRRDLVISLIFIQNFKKLVQDVHGFLMIPGII